MEDIMREIIAVLDTATLHEPLLIRTTIRAMLRRDKE